MATYLPFHFFFNFTLWSAKTAKSTILQVLSFFIITKSGRPTEIRWLGCVSKSLRNLCISFSRTDAGLCIYHLLVWLNFYFLHNSQWIALPTQSCPVLYSFYANLLHSLIVWLMVSSLSPHNLDLFCCVLSILVLIWLFLMVLFCAAIRRDSVSLLFQFLSFVHVFSCEM